MSTPPVTQRTCEIHCSEIEDPYDQIAQIALNSYSRYFESQDESNIYVQVRNICILIQAWTQSNSPLPPEKITYRKTVEDLSESMKTQVERCIEIERMYKTAQTVIRYLRLAAQTLGRREETKPNLESQQKRSAHLIEELSHKYLELSSFTKNMQTTYNFLKVALEPFARSITVINLPTDEKDPTPCAYVDRLIEERKIEKQKIQEQVMTRPELKEVREKLDMLAIQEQLEKAIEDAQAKELEAFNEELYI